MTIKNQIFASNDLKTDVVDATEWGIPKLNVRELTASQRCWIFEKMQDMNGKTMPDDEYFAILVSMGTVDADGKRVFSDEDAKELLNKSPFILRRIGQAINELSGISNSAVDDAEKNS